MFRATLARNARLFSTSVRVGEKGPVKTAADAIHAADKTVSQHIVKGIEKGEEVAAKAKEAAGVGAAKAEQAGKDAAQSAHDTKEQAKGAAKTKL